MSLATATISSVTEGINPIAEARDTVRESLTNRSLRELKLARTRLERRTEFGDWEEIAAHMGAVLAVNEEIALREAVPEAVAA